MFTWHELILSQFAQFACLRVRQIRASVCANAFACVFCVCVRVCLFACVCACVWLGLLKKAIETNAKFSEFIQRQSSFEGARVCLR